MKTRRAADRPGGRGALAFGTAGRYNGSSLRGTKVAVLGKIAFGTMLILGAALLAGCRNGESADEGEVRLPILSDAKRPVLSDRNPVSPYSEETAQQMAAPGPGAEPPPVVAEPNRPAERRQTPGAQNGRYEVAPRPLPILSPGDESPAPPANGDETLSETGSRIKVVNAIVARINSEIITREDLIRDIRGQMALWRESLPPDEFEIRVRIELRNRLQAEISRRLVLQEAKKEFKEAQQELLDNEVEKERQRQLAFLDGSEARWQAELARQGLTEEKWKQIHADWLIVQAFLAKHLEPRITVTHQEMVDYYESVKGSRYTIKPQEHMMLIKLQLKDHASHEAMMSLARSLVARARSGEDFRDLAREFSRGPKAADGGDWRMMHRGSHRLDAVNEALATLPVGSVSDPIVADTSVYIVKVADRIVGRVVPFTEAQEECRRAVREMKRADMVAQYVQDLYEKNHVEIHEENL